MKNEEALSQGLHFTGLYKTYDKDSVLAEIKAERVKYPKARIVIVKERVSKLSRSNAGAPGYSAYADAVYFALKQNERIGNPDINHDNCLNQLKSEYETKVTAANERWRIEREQFAKNLQIIDAA